MRYLPSPVRGGVRASRKSMGRPEDGVVCQQSTNAGSMLAALTSAISRIDDLALDHELAKALLALSARSVRDKMCGIHFSELERRRSLEVEIQHPSHVVGSGLR